MDLYSVDKVTQYSDAHRKQDKEEIKQIIAAWVRAKQKS